MAGAWLMASAANADELDHAFCQGVGLEDPTPFALARVSGSGRLPLQYGPDICRGGTPNCLQKAYVVPGDVLVIQTRKGGMICAIHPKSNVSGWIPADRLTVIPVKTPDLRDWQGEWRQRDNLVDLTVKDGKLIGKGQVYWPSMHPPKSFPGSGPNDGGFDAVAKPANNRVTFREGPDADDCAVRLTLVGTWLVASDNNRCGGVNARILGIFAKK